MFFCVRLADVERHLASLGFYRRDETETSIVFFRGDNEQIVIRNSYDIPEFMVDGAYNSAGLDPPEGGWDVFQTAP